MTNRTIFTGDNLDVLRGFNSGCVDLIYLDPPFNSRREYSAPVGSKAAGAAFRDTWHWDDVDAAWLGEVADAEPRVAAVVEAAGTVHGRGMKSYLLMMGVRLIELRRVLKPTGSIWLHCDPTANSYLRLLMDAVFGRAQMRRNEIVWTMPRRSGFNDAGEELAGSHDTLLFYAGDGAKFNKQYEPYTAAKPPQLTTAQTRRADTGCARQEAATERQGLPPVVGKGRPALVGRHRAYHVPKA